jgi:hypothetical protein
LFLALELYHLVVIIHSALCQFILRGGHVKVRWDRPELIRLLDQLRTGDILIVLRLDRLSRSLRDLLMIMERIEEAEAGFRSLGEAIDTATAPGRMICRREFFPLTKAIGRNQTAPFFKRLSIRLRRVNGLDSRVDRLVLDLGIFGPVRN